MQVAVPERAKEGTILWMKGLLPEFCGTRTNLWKELLKTASLRHPGEFLRNRNKVLVEIWVT